MDVAAHELRKEGKRVRLADKPFLVLAALLEHPGEVVTREDLRRRLWAEDTFVDFDNNLNSAVATLREALGDAARTPHFIETLPRRGYRFVGTLEDVPADNGSAIQAAGIRRALTKSPWLTVGIALGLLAAIVWVGNGSRLVGTAARHASAVSKNKNYVDGAYLLERDDRQSLERAVNLLTRAAGEEPRNAVTQAALGEAWIKQTLYGLAPPDIGFANAESAIRRALEVNPDLPAAHRGLAQVKLHRYWDFQAAEREIQRAVAGGPGDAKNHLIAAMVAAASGRHEESVVAARRAIQLDPADWRVRADLAYFLLSAGRFEEALAESQAVLDLDPNFGPALDFLLASGEHLGRFDEARAAALGLMRRSRASEADLRAVERASARVGVRLYHEWQIRLMEERGPNGWPAMTVASIYASAGRADQAFEWLRRAYDGRECNLVFLGASPDFAPVRKDPRYTEMIRRMGLPEALPGT